MKQFVSTLNIGISKYDPFIGYEWVKIYFSKKKTVYTHMTLDTHCTHPPQKNP